MSRAIIFDFDGVIAETEPLHYEAFARVLREMRVSLERSTYFARYVGLSDREILRRLAGHLRRDWTSEKIARLLGAKRFAYLSLIERGIPLLPGLRDAVERWARGYELAICSGSQRVEIEVILGQSGLLDRFPVIVAADDVPASKPDPQGYRLVLRKLQDSVPDLSAHQCLVIEDSAAGIRAAQAAGMCVVALQKPYGPDLSTLADAMIEDLTELTDQRLEALLPPTPP